MASGVGSENRSTVHYVSPPVNEVAVAGTAAMTMGSGGGINQLPPMVQKLLNAVIGGDAQSKDTIDTLGAKHPRIMQILERIAGLQQNGGDLAQVALAPATSTVQPDGTTVNTAHVALSPSLLLMQLGAMVKGNGGGHITKEQEAQLNASLDQLGAPPIAGATQDASVPPGGDLPGATLAVATPTGDGVTTVDPTTDGQTV